jgi:hypothetical protein
MQKGDFIPEEVSESCYLAIHALAGVPRQIRDGYHRLYTAGWEAARKEADRLREYYNIRDPALIEVRIR